MIPTPTAAFLDELLRAGYLLLVMALVFAAIALGFLRSRALYGGSQEHAPEELTNCPDCGSRTPRERHDCEYCGEPLPSDRRGDRSASSVGDPPEASSDLHADRRK